MDQQILDLLSKRLDKIDDKFDSLSKDINNLAQNVARIEGNIEIQNTAHDRAADKLANIDTRLDDYNASLQEHMRRTDLLEKNLDSLEREKIDPLHQAFAADQVERQLVEKQRDRAYRMVKFVGAFIGAVVGLITLYNMFK